MICFAISHATDRAALEQHAAAISGLPVYVLDENFVAPGSWLLSSALGAVVPHLAEAFEDAIRERGEWVSAWPALWLNFSAIEAQAAAAVIDDPGLRDAVAIDWTLGVLIHELGHLVDIGHVPAATRGTAAIVRSIAEAPSGRRQDLLPWKHHESRWIRAVLHLHCRLELLLGMSIPLSRVAMLDRYLLSSIYGYHRALDGEPEVRLDQPLQEILDSDPPASFLELWRDDMGRYARSLSADGKQAFLRGICS